MFLEFLEKLASINYMDFTSMKILALRMIAKLAEVTTILLE